MEFESCETTSVSWYRVSTCGLKISTFRLAIFARFSRRINSSVLPENIDPHTTSIHPDLDLLTFGSKNMYKICRLPYKFDFKLQKQMEIRNALQKIENYLTVVSNLNRTILSEGTMSRDELLLMKKYLYTSIDRIEDIERSLIIDQRDDKSFVPTAPTETLFTPAKEKEIVEVADTTHVEQVEAALNAAPVVDEFPALEEIQTELLPEEKVMVGEVKSVSIEPVEETSLETGAAKEEKTLEILPLVESIITEDYSLNQWTNEQEEASAPVNAPEETVPVAQSKSFAESIITEDYSLNRLFENTAETAHPALVNEQNEVVPVFAGNKEETIANIITEDYSLNRAEVTSAPVQELVSNEVKEEKTLVTFAAETTVKAETLVSQFEEKKPLSFVEALESNKHETLSFTEQPEQKTNVTPQPQLFEMFDHGKEELHETFSNESTFSEVVSFEKPASVVPAFEQHDTVLVAEKEVETIVEELTPSSLNDIFKPQTVAETLNAKVSKTLSESIALNDKFIFVRELFGNQFSEYENGLKQLDTLNSFELAENYCKEKLWNKFNWSAKTPSVERFMAVLQKRFN